MLRLLFKTMTPTPKEKAKQLVDKFYNELDSIGDKWIRQIEAEACALLAVDELIDIIEYKVLQAYFVDNYWQQVKEEIEKL